LRIFLLALSRRSLPAGRTNVPLVMMFFDSLTTHLIVVAGIQTQMLRFFLCWPRALDYDGLDGFLEQDMVIDVGRSDNDRQRPALPVHEQTFFDPCLARSAGLGAIRAPPLLAFQI